MGNLFDYIAWRGDLSFEQSPLNEVDSLIFSLISYIDFSGIISKQPGESPSSLCAVANSFFANNPDPKKLTLGLIVPKDIIKLFRALKDTKRFRRVGMSGYVNIIDLDRQMQFSATTFTILPDETVVAFRGTDDTLVGWKENFNMSFLETVPAQEAAVEYLNHAADLIGGKLYVTGHSKGGNLSVYAGVKCRPDVWNRIDTVWGNDGPGFNVEFLHSNAYYQAKPKIRTLVPQDSVVGMLLEHDDDYTVIKSRNVGLAQHDALSWCVVGNSFLHLPNVTGECKRTNKAVHEWISGMTFEQREEFCNAVYQILSADSALTVTDLVSLKNQWLLRSRKLSPEVRKAVTVTLSELVRINTKTLFTDLFPKPPERNTIN